MNLNPSSMTYFVRNSYVFAAHDGREVAMAPIAKCVTVTDLCKSIEVSVISRDFVKHGMLMEAIRFKSVFIPAGK